uniref:Uncharacterized protein n=1 Tax=Peronospora matthiolae TaxID=2874970 RepID=A0AAV1U1F1_9STRA
MKGRSAAKEKREKDPDAVNQKPRAENVNALLDIHMDRTSNGT